MFESAEIEHTITKKQYEDELPQLRTDLLGHQYELLTSKERAVMIVIAGVDGAGKGDTVNLLHWWLDPRHLQTHGMGRPSDEEAERPPFWRFWRRLPPGGKTGIFFGSWYTVPIIERVYGDTNDSDLEQAMEHIRRFEQMLTDEGVVLLKLWFHLSKKQQHRRLKSLEKDPLTRWRVSETDWRHYKLYDDFYGVCTHALRLTSTDCAPWIIIPGAEAHYRQLMVGRAVNEALATANRPHDSRPSGAIMQPPAAADGRNVLDVLDLSQHTDKKTYERKLERAQGRLNALVRSAGFRERSLIVVFEGLDAAGKGGAIRRLTSALDARTYHVVPTAAPSEEERAQPYLWRFWRHAPRQGKVVIFDRSWYGRLLVERVEELCAPHDWMRAYGEINDFEDQLSDHGAIIVKLWMHIDQEEQLRRFEERRSLSFKRHKLTDDDWRNRDKWPTYEQAVVDMVERTSTELAKWTLVEANDKRFARLKVLDTVCDRLEVALKKSSRRRR